MILKNNTNGAWADDSIFVTITAVDPTDNKQFVVVPGPLDAEGIPVSRSFKPTVDQQNHETKEACESAGSAWHAHQTAHQTVEQCYPKVWFTLAELKNYQMGTDPHRGSRIWFSMGQPLYMRMSEGPASRLILPNIGDVNDVNYQTIHDFFEFTYDPYAKEGNIPFGGNTTQVDAVGIPLEYTLESHSLLYPVRGIHLVRGGQAISRSELFKQYIDEVPPTFSDTLVQKSNPESGPVLRVIAPYKSSAFMPGNNGDELKDYFSDKVGAIWRHYEDNELNHWDQPPPKTGNRVGNRFVGSVDGEGYFVFDVFMIIDGEEKKFGPHKLKKPSSYELFTQSIRTAFDGDQGAAEATLIIANDPDRGLAHATALAMWRDLSTAVLRGVALDFDDFYEPDKYYADRDGIFHHYAKFLHSVSHDGKAYAYGYDDAGDQSSVLILPNGEYPKSLEISVNW